MSDPHSTIRVWYLAVYLRNNPDPVMVAQASREAALSSVAYVASTWMRFPPEARPASCWLVAHTGVVTRMSVEGVESATQVDVLGVFDPREIAAIYVVPHDVEAWKAGV